MGYKDKLSEGIDAKGSFTFTQVKDATTKVARAMGEKAIKVIHINDESSIISLEVFDTGVRKVTGRSLFGAIAGAVTKAPDILANLIIERSEDGTRIVSVNISEAATTSSSVMFIPAGTTVHGIATYRDFLSHLTAELKRIDPNAKITRRGKQ